MDYIAKTWRYMTTQNIPSFQKLKLPNDEEGFVQSFTIDQVEESKEFFNKYGLVIYRNVLTEEECDKAVDAVWEQVNQIVSGIKKDDPSTWWVFPSGSLGILGSDIAATKSAWETRQNEKVYKAFCNILGTDDLLSSVDRYGLMRPTKKVKMSDGKEEDHPEWRTKDAWFHWDLNPWTFQTSPALTKEQEEKRIMNEKGEIKWKNPKDAAYLFITENNERPKVYFGDCDKVQGLVAFEDSTVKDGGFQCVPGFNSFIEEWSKKVIKISDSDYVSCPKVDNDIYPNIERVSMRKGSLLVWSGLLPHCNFPNESSRFRVCQYLKMFPRKVLPTSEIPGYLEERCNALKERMPSDFQVSQTGQQVFGFKYVSNSQ